MLCFERDDTFYNRFAYPLVFVSIEQRDAMAEYLFMKNIDTVRPYQDSVELGTDYYGYHSDCPVTERVSKCILLIPGYYKLKQHEIHYITKCLNEGWDIISSRQRNGQFHDSEITS